MLLPQPVTKLVELFESLPGIGPKTAQRLVFYLLRTPAPFKCEFSEALIDLNEKVMFCRQCFNISDGDLCSICQDHRREQNILCVVEEPLDLIALEQGGYKGLYHVLGGALSPLNNIGPDELRIKELLERVESGLFDEIILATNPSVEGEATAMFLKQKLQERMADGGRPTAKLTRLGRGLPVGADVEYADAQTLARSLEGRQTY